LETASEPSAQSSKRLEVLHVQGVRRDSTGPLGAPRLLRLDHHRQSRKARVVDDPSERFEAEAALADVLVTVDTASAWFLRVIRVECAQPVESYDAIEALEGIEVAGLRGDVISGGDEMAGVEADADA
jgi:hypothetical protein